MPDACAREASIDPVNCDPDGIVLLCLLQKARSHRPASKIRSQPRIENSFRLYWRSFSSLPRNFPGKALDELTLCPMNNLAQSDRSRRFSGHMSCVRSGSASLCDHELKPRTDIGHWPYGERVIIHPEQKQHQSLYRDVYCRKIPRDKMLSWKRKLGLQ